MAEDKEIKTIADFFLEVMKQKGISSQKLSELSGVHIAVINNILNERFDKLPAAPYLRGYIIKISAVLGLNGDKVWKEILKQEPTIKRSGKYDLLPQSKKITNLNKTIIILAIAVTLLIVSFFIAYSVNKPKIMLNLSGDIITTTSPKILVSGSIKNGDKLLLNGEIIELNENKEFEKEINLQPGLNLLVFETSKYLGPSVKVVRQIYYDANNLQNLQNTREN